MSYEFKRNKKGLYQLKNTVNDKKSDWITEDEVKKFLIEKAYADFIHTTIEIDMEFPNDYYINGKHQMKESLHQLGSIFVLKNWGKPEIKDKFKDICKRLNLKL